MAISCNRDQLPSFESGCSPAASVRRPTHDPLMPTHVVFSADHVVTVEGDIQHVHDELADANKAGLFVSFVEKGERVDVWPGSVACLREAPTLGGRGW